MASQATKGESVAAQDVYTIIVVGCGGVGKSAVTLQFMYDEFPEEYVQTKADQYGKKVVFDGREISANILDTAGQEDYSAIRDNYFRTGEGFMCVFSLTDADSLTALDELRDQILRVKNHTKVPLILVANKVDLEEMRKIDGVALREKASLWGVPFIETSAKTKLNVDKAFFELLREIKRWKESQQVSVKPHAAQTSQETKCCLIL